LQLEVATVMVNPFSAASAKIALCQSLSIYLAEGAEVVWRKHSHPFKAADQKPSSLPLSSNWGNLVP